MVLTSLLAPLAPPACFGCGGHCRWGDPLCAACRRELVWLGPELVPLGGGEGAGDGRSAPGDPVPLWAPLAYRGGAAALVRALKFRGALGVAGDMAAQMLVTAPAGLLGGAALVPVPLDPARARRRGFNQAERLAAALARRAGLEVADVLRRQAGLPTQMGRPRRERIAALNHAVEVRPGGAIPARAVLVDDVATTGATLRACVDALLRAGCPVGAAVTYARTPGR